MADGPTRVLVADDSVLVREGVRAILDAEPGFSIASCVGSYDDAVAAIMHGAPDVLITDIRMPPTGTDEGVRLAQELRVSHPQLGVLVLSQHLGPEYALTLLQDGSNGRGYILKERLGDAGQLVAAVSAVAGGGSFIDAAVVDALVEARTRVPGGPLASLTKRELEVLAEVATGKSNAAIANATFVSERAVEKHVGSIFTKLGLLDDASMNRRVAAVLLYLSQ